MVSVPPGSPRTTCTFTGAVRDPQRHRRRPGRNRRVKVRRRRLHARAREAHQLINTGTEPLVYYLVADNPPHAFGYRLPKWACGAGEIFPAEVDYHDGEE